VTAAALLDQLHTTFGFSAFRGVQDQVVGRVMAGQSTLAVMPTGAGKSLTYQLPAVMMPGTCVVISPLIALMHDQLRSPRPTASRRHADQRRCEDREATIDALPRWRTRSALCRARTRQPAAFPRTAEQGAGQPLSPSTKRTAFPNGATISAPTTACCAR
jgi:hypothetical protein